MKDTKKANTYIEKLGFKDKDIRSNIHDKLVLSLFDMNKLYSLLNLNGICIVQDYYEVKEDNYEITSRKRVRIEEIKGCLKIISEHPIKSNYGQVLGFIDIKIMINRAGCYFHKITNENPLRIESRNIEELVIEIKSKITTFGEILREINFYRSNYHSGNIALFCIASLECLLEQMTFGQIVMYLNL